MTNQELLDLHRKEVLAPANDHVFEPAYNVKVALLVHGGQVSAMQPTLGVDGLGGLLGHLVVTSHDHEAAIAEFAALTYRHDLAGRRIDDFDLDMQQLPSVCPKQMRTSAPSRAFTCSIRKRGTGAPPDPTTLSEERS